MSGSEYLTPHSLKDLLAYLLRLGTFGFGGPIALASRMEKDLVERRRWLSREDYLEALAFSQLSPAPLAAQLAMYIGWVHARGIGAFLSAVAFIMPSFLMATGVAAAYVRFGELSWIQGLFYGIGAAVIGLIAQSAYRLSRKTIGKDLFLWVPFVVVAVTTVYTGSEIVWLFILCGFICLLWRSRAWFASYSILVYLPQWMVAGIQGPASSSVLVRLGLFFLQAGAFVFGSGLAIVPFLYGGAVNRFHWITEQQFVDAIAVAMITPGPVVITAAFIGYLVAGPSGGTIAAVAVFAPPF